MQTTRMHKTLNGSSMGGNSWESTHPCSPCVWVCVCAGGGSVLRGCVCVSVYGGEWHWPCLWFMRGWPCSGLRAVHEREWGHILLLLGRSPLDRPCRAAKHPQGSGRGTGVCVHALPPQAPSATPLLSHPGWGLRRGSWGCWRGGRT